MEPPPRLQTEIAKLADLLAIWHSATSQPRLTECTLGNVEASVPGLLRLQGLEYSRGGTAVAIRDLSLRMGQVNARVFG